MQQLIRTARTLEAEWWKFVGKCRYRDKGRWVKYLAHLGCWISPYYSPFSACVWNLWTTYFFNFPNFLGDRVKLQITENTDNESADTGVHLYFTGIYLLVTN